MSVALSLRRFTDYGLIEVERLLTTSSDSSGIALTALLTRDDLTELISEPTDVTPQDFKNRWECGKFFHNLIEQKRSEIHRDPETDRGLWTWLAVAWFNYLKKPDAKDGAGWQTERWILGLRWSRYYKHLLAGPWIVFRKHSDSPDFCKVLLLPEITKPGHDISEHFLCKYELVNSPGFVAVLNDLYLSADGTGYKKGMQGNGKGTVKRLRLFTGQLELTYDLMSLTRERILELLPSEFDRFR